MKNLMTEAIFFDPQNPEVKKTKSIIWGDQSLQYKDRGDKFHVEEIKYSDLQIKVGKNKDGLLYFSSVHKNIHFYIPYGKNLTDFLKTKSNFSHVFTEDLHKNNQKVKAQIFIVTLIIVLLLFFVMERKNLLEILDGKTNPSQIMNQ